ncbi:MAG: Hpt domain-containing protein [Alphaproteobacteria bacterium]|nr:Hpt domain-containing protein [Alphaproteobacteria bacterium]
MTAPVDLTNLREITEGDEALEAELFHDFISSFEDILLQMHSKTIEEGWAKDAHALKGLASNLGAERLTKICHEAQHSQSDDENAIYVDRIKDEYRQVCAYLLSLL